MFMLCVARARPMQFYAKIVFQEVTSTMPKASLRCYDFQLVMLVEEDARIFPISLVTHYSRVRDLAEIHTSCEE